MFLRRILHRQASFRFFLRQRRESAVTAIQSLFYFRADNCIRKVFLCITGFLSLSSVHPLQRLLTENDTAVIKASSFYHLSNFLKRGRLKTDKLITISGDNVKTPSIIKIKIGTPVNKILKIIKEKKGESVYFGNGLMSGKEVSINNLVVTEELSSIIIMKKENIEMSCKKEGKCINCGACIDICPVGINPILFKNENYYQKCKDKCLKCGLCSYICPVYINFNCSNRKGEANE